VRRPQTQFRGRRLALSEALAGVLAPPSRYVFGCGVV
jgi:hypothetical protein